MDEETSIMPEKNPSSLDIVKDKFDVDNKEYLVESFSKDVRNVLEEGNISQLKELYYILSEADNVDKGKIACLKLYDDCFVNMMNIIKDDSDKTLKYHVWHFLQLMTCCSNAKNILLADTDAIPLLLQLNTCDWDGEELLSLKNISLNYILVMLADATNEYYEYIASIDVIPYFYKMLESCVLRSDDTLIELLLLGLNLLLEGSGMCKKQLIELDFKSLMSKKIEQRGKCDESMLKVANQTYQKFTLLSCESKAFVETFRQGFNEEVKKNTLYQPITCYNIACNSLNESTQDDMKTSFKRCSRCKTATYCSKECQIAHWKDSHSKLCTSIT